MTPVKFTPAEAGHILSLIHVNAREGWYYRPKEQYWKRSERIKAKIQNSFSEKDKPKSTQSTQ